MVFFFGSSNRSNTVLQSNIGPCQFCQHGKVDLLESRRQFWIWCCIPTKPTSYEMVKCRSCRKIIKAEYYYCNEKTFEKKDDVDAVILGTPVPV